MTASLTDDDGKLAFVIQLLRAPWPDEGLAMPHEGRGKSYEDHGNRRLFHTAFGGMVDIVQAQTNDLVRMRNRGQIDELIEKARLCLDLTARDLARS